MQTCGTGVSLPMPTPLDHVAQLGVPWYIYAASPGPSGAGIYLRSTLLTVAWLTPVRLAISD